MNILYITHHFTPDVVAGALRAYKLSRALSELKHHVHIVTADKGNLPVSENLFPLPENCKIYKVSGIHIYYLPAGYGYIRTFVKKGLKIIKDNKIDIIFATSPTISAAIAGYKLSKQTKIPLVVEYRDPWIRSYRSWTLNKGGSHISRSSLQGIFFLGIEKRILHHAKRIIVTNQEIAKEIKNVHSDLPDEKFEVVYNFPDIGRVKPKKFDRYTIFCSGVLYRERGIPNIISAMQFLDNVQLLLAGFAPASDMNLYKKIIDNLKLHNTVKFLGVLPPDRKLYSMQAGADLLFIGQIGKKLNYNLPARIFEYMAAGKPILALAIPGSGLDHIVSQNKCGKVIYSSSPEHIAKAVKILQDKKLANKLGKAGKQAIKNEYNMQIQSKKLSDIFEEVLNNF